MVGAKTTCSGSAFQITRNFRLWLPAIAQRGNGDVALLGPDATHSVVNPLDRLSGAIHVYDGDFLAAQRSMWNAETLTEEPYDYAKVLKGNMPLTHT